MIIGIGVDLADIARFERTIQRTPRLLERMFGPVERELPLRSLAARYAAREALIKALGGSDGLAFHEVEIISDARGKPSFSLSGGTAEVVAAKGGTTVHLSMSHDADLAIAYVIVEGPGPVAAAAPASNASVAPKNQVPAETSRDAVGLGGDVVSRGAGAAGAGATTPYEATAEGSSA
jgi:holo-[acyl-carrier protein] synthase